MEGVFVIQGIVDFFTNRILMISVITMLLAQLVKGIIDAVVKHHFDFSRLWGNGGMPSAHAALIASLCTSCGWFCGMDSAEFAICVVIALIVCRDAVGVRFETAKQTTAIKELIEAIELLGSEKLPDVKLKELEGHTPFQVLVGMIFGVITSVIICALIA